jgi:hypothetical protein
MSASAVLRWMADHGALKRRNYTELPGAESVKSHMEMAFKIVGLWFALNLAIPTFILYQRSPHFRHRLFRFTLGGLASPSERRLAHVLVEAAHHRR